MKKSNLVTALVLLVPIVLTIYVGIADQKAQQRKQQEKPEEKSSVAIKRIMDELLINNKTKWCGRYDEIFFGANALKGKRLLKYDIEKEGSSGLELYNEKEGIWTVHYFVQSKSIDTEGKEITERNFVMLKSREHGEDKQKEITGKKPSWCLWIL